MKNIREILTILRETGTYLIDREKNIVITREQIGEMISGNYEEAVVCLEENLFRDAFDQADREMAAILQTIEGKYATSEEILFQLQYQLCPNMPFSYKEVIYRDVAFLGNSILSGKAEKATIVEAMQSKMISFYAKFKNLDEVRSDIIEHIEYAENYIDKDPEIAYNLLGYYLSDRKWYKYDGHKFLSVVTLYTYLSTKKRLVAFSNNMANDYLFIAWLYCLGNGKTYEHWLEEVNRINMMDYEANFPVEEPKKGKKKKK